MDETIGRRGTSGLCIFGSLGVLLAVGHILASVVTLISCASALSAWPFLAERFGFALGNDLDDLRVTRMQLDVARLEQVKVHMNSF